MVRTNKISRYLLAIPFSYYGYAFQKTWSSIDIGDAPNIAFLSGGFQELVGGILFLSLIPIAVLCKNSTYRKPLFYAGFVAQLLSALIYFYIDVFHVTDQMFLVANVIIKAIGLVAISALWIEFYASLNPLKATFLIASSVCITAVILFILSNDHGTRLTIARLALSVLSAYCYWICLRSGSSQNEYPEETSFRVFPYKAVIYVAICSFAYGSTLSAMGPGLTNYVSAVPAAIILLITIFSARKIGVVVIGYIATIIMACGYLMTILLPQGFSPVASAVLDIGYGLMGLIVLLIVCTISHSTGASALWLFGILTGCQFVCYHLGFWFNHFIPAGASSLDSVVSGIIVITALVICSYILTSEKNLNSSWGASGKTELSAPISDKSNSYALSFGLTGREKEVLECILQGDTIATIANKMIVSESTVKSHLHNIYSKFGVHSRSELLKILNREKQD